MLAVPNADILSKFELFDDAGQPLPVEELPGRRALRGLTAAPRMLRFRVRETGEERWSMVTSQAVLDAAVQIELAVTIFHEITERGITEAMQRPQKIDQNLVDSQQARRVMENLRAVLEAAGASFGSVVKTTIYLQDLKDFVAVNEVYGGYFTQAPPARATVQVAGLPRGALVEIDAIALV